MRAVNRIADGRAIVARARRVERRRATRSTRAEKEGEQMNQEMAGGEIGLGGLEDMMDKADGGATPDFVKSLGVKELDDVFAILGSQTKGAELGQLVLSEKFGETLYRESGFTSLAETINGRCAMVGFVLAVMNTFNGDLLTMMAKVPLAVVFVIATISAASVVQKVNPTGYIPDNVNGAAMNAYSGAKLDEVFTYKAELVNGRMAMLAMLFFVATASIF
ncbi:possible early light inducible protein [Ostreococcus lucimarinus CCE9901]|uniref:Possible early light inducible protein n=1 Tax=Ostreococcus lucimarinus (strain CCE9901) TaxID=436017 RepID=A4S1Y6_OSTLU|nr:possible early light inducible protein [Ostreococcus lucimarinus CCE9901]ABO97523.1 possible early light inducible protein [Ostreococcus lucimarinus CCE9901]|eukprot:XP_001419230.1 possible early light inducible protein [Ostreococcus lucimarinus CCE9901]